MLNKIKEKALYSYVQLRSLARDKRGADMVEWVAIIAVVAGVIVLLSPTVRSNISSFFSNTFNNLRNMSIGR